MTPAEIATARDSRALSDIVRGYGIHLYRIGRDFKGLCPFHKERTPSFHVSDQRGTFKCFGCGAWGDSIDFIMQIRSVSFIEAVQALDPAATPHNGRSYSFMRKPTGERAEDESRRMKYAHELWLKRQPIDNTWALEYLRIARGVDDRVIPDRLGFVEAYCSTTKKVEPALISPLQDSQGHVTAVQLVYLSGPFDYDALRDENGRRLKRTFGLMRDGCVRLATHTTTMGLAGSVEDGLSVIARYSIPTWAVCGEQRLSRVWVPEEVEHLIIFADADEPGRRAAEEAREHHLGVRRGNPKSALEVVEVVYPEHGKDFNEEVANG